MIQHFKIATSRVMLLKVTATPAKMKMVSQLAVVSAAHALEVLVVLVKMKKGTNEQAAAPNVNYVLIQ